MEKSSIAESARPAAVTSSRFEEWFTAVFFFLFAAVVWASTRAPGALRDLFENAAFEVFRGRELAEFTDRQAPAGAPVPDLSNRAGLYFFLVRVNPTRFAEVPPMAAFEYEILRDLEARRPALVFLESGGWLDAIDGIPNSRRIPRVWSRVLENYPARVKVGDTVVALRTEPRS